MKVEKIAIEKIVPYEKNVKRHSEQQIEKIAKSIKEVWFIQPLVVDENYVIIIGHGRFEAMKSLWNKEVDCVVLKWLSEKQKKALRIKDNKLNESPFDMSNLQEELQSLFDDGEDLLDLWFNMFEIEQFGLEIPELKNEVVNPEEIGGGEEDDEEWAEPQTARAYEINVEKKAYDFSNVQWVQENTRKPITFYLTPEEYEKYGVFFQTAHKWEANIELLKEVVDFYLANNGWQWE